MYNSDADLLHALVHGFSNAMLVSRYGDTLRSRPATIARTRDARRLWLLCGVIDDDFADLRAPQDIQLILQDSGRFCAVTGSARVARLPRRPRKAGARDVQRGSQLVLIEVRPRFAEYWDRSGSRGLRLEPSKAGRRRGPSTTRPTATPTPREKLGDNVIVLDTARRRR